MSNSLEMHSSTKDQRMESITCSLDFPMDNDTIWIRHAGDYWFIGNLEDLGTATVALYEPIKDPNKECPHDNLQSNWSYGAGGNGFVQDVSDSVRIHCLKGNCKNQPVIDCNYLLLI